MNEKVPFLEAKEYLQEQAESLMKQRIEEKLKEGKPPRGLLLADL